MPPGRAGGRPSWWIGARRDGEDAMRGGGGGGVGSSRAGRMAEIEESWRRRRLAIVNDCRRVTRGLEM